MLVTAIDEVSQLVAIATVGGRRVGADDVPEILRSDFGRFAAANRSLGGSASPLTMDSDTYRRWIADLESLDTRPSPQLPAGLHR